MELATQEAHRTLAYLVALNDQGYRPSASEVDAYGANPDRLTVRGSPFGIGLVAARMAQLHIGLGYGEETPTEHLTRLEWAYHYPNGELVATPLGRAVLGHLEEAATEAGTVFTLHLDRDDPMALARVVERLAGAGEALLVDPYFGVDTLGVVALETAITRVLIGERSRKEVRSSLRVGVESLTLDRPFEVRVAGHELHDRCLIPDSGDVQVIGSSLNSIGKVLTVFGPIHDGGGQIREAYESMWRNAECLAVCGEKSTGEPEERESESIAG